MKKLLIIASIALLSTTAQAENTAEASKAVEAKQETTANTAQIENRTASDLIIAKSGESNSNLWKMLDINKDGSLSKTEATSSKEVIMNWDNLDSNKDGNLDTEEFAYFFSLQN